jgi:pimeloyl-ACP methyl ester carboxylesterase
MPIGETVHIPLDAGVALTGDLTIPDGARGVVLFAHGSGSSRLSPRNRRVASSLVEGGVGTLLFDLLTPSEEERDAVTRELRFDIPLLGERLVRATDWVATYSSTRNFPVGYFGASTGAAAALMAAALRPERVGAVVSRGGRPDLAGRHLERVQAPTLLIVGGYDAPVIEMNREALDSLGARVKELAIIPRAGHLFEEPGALEQVAELAREWFVRYLIDSAASRAG